MFATLIFLPQTKLIPIQNIKTEPIKEAYATAVSVIIGDIKRASRVIPPSKINTGIAEKAHPCPMDEVITAVMIKSKTFPRTSRVCLLWRKAIMKPMESVMRHPIFSSSRRWRTAFCFRPMRFRRGKTEVPFPMLLCGR